MTDQAHELSSGSDSEAAEVGLSGGRGALLEQCRVANIACCEELVEEFSDNALLRAGADAAVRVVLEYLAKSIRQIWVSDVTEGRSDLDQMWNNALLIPRREIEALLKEVTDA